MGASNTGKSIAERLEEIEQRLEEIEAAIDESGEPRGSRRIEDLVAEAHRLERALEQISDQSAQESEGLAEALVKEQGANADEIPDLPQESEGS